MMLNYPQITQIYADDINLFASHAGYRAGKCRFPGRNKYIIPVPDTFFTEKTFICVNLRNLRIVSTKC